MIFRSLLHFMLLLTRIASEIDENYIIGKPFVSCQQDGISLVAHLKHNFEGQLYVKGSQTINNCVKKYKLEENATEVHLKIAADRLKACGFNYWQKPNSNKMLISGSIVVAFHPDLVTSSDRAFAIHCEFDNFERIADIKLQSNLQSEKTVFGHFDTPLVRMQIINPEKMEVNDNKTEDDPKTFRIGDSIVLQWKLIENEGIFGMEIDECYVESKNSESIQIIKNGCSMDEELVSDTVSSKDHTKIYANSKVFRFPDHHMLYFRCLVRICVRRIENVKLINERSIGDFCELNSCKAKIRNRRNISTENFTNRIIVSEKYSITSDLVPQNESYNRNSDSLQFCVSRIIYYSSFTFFAFIYIFTFSVILFYNIGKY